MVVWNKKRATGIGPSGRLDLRYCAENKPNGFKEEKAENWKKMSLMEKGNYCSVRYIKHKQQKQKRMSEIMNKTD